MRWIWSVLLCAGLSAQAATTFYVDALNGSDGNSGTAPSLAWQSLDKVNHAAFHPGDHILFKSGSHWNGYLAPKSSGEEGSPIVIDSYGGTALPRIDGAGQVEDTVRLYNVQQIELHHLEITNQGSSEAVRRGVHLFLDNFGTAKHIVLAHLYIHDVNGIDAIKDNGGIIFRTRGEKTPSRFDGLVIEQNIIQRVDRSAIAADSYHARRDHWFPSLHVVIRDNYLEDIGGDGIVPWATDGALVEHNIARECNHRSKEYNAGIWPWSTDNTLLRWNDASRTHGTKDGEGFDSDFNSRNTVFEFNYSHENDGGFMLVCAPGKESAERNIGNLGTVIRYNISRHDHERLMNLSGGDNTIVEKNVFYIAPGEKVQLLTSAWDGWSKGVVFRGNTFYSEGVLQFGHQVDRSDDGKYKIASGWGGATGIVWEGNHYFGQVVGRPHDPQGQVAFDFSYPVINWTSPTFDPSHPEKLDAFLAEHRRWMTELFRRQFGTGVAMASFVRGK